MLNYFKFKAWFTLTVLPPFDCHPIKDSGKLMAASASENKHIEHVSDCTLVGKGWKGTTLAVISLCVICHVYTGMMTSWLCRLLKIHQRRRTWKTGWLGQWKNTQIHVQFLSAGMVSMCGASRGKKRRLCEHLFHCTIPLVAINMIRYAKQDFWWSFWHF